MSASPFKFLDSFTKEDKDTFFGRDNEIDKLHSSVFETDLVLLYGVSGTGKSSLIQCGLANKFQDSDWLPIPVRRGSDINNSLADAITKAALTPVKSSDNFIKSLKSLYLDHFKPIYLIFDQLEELFIFGTDEEKEAFVDQVASIIDAELQCRFIFVIREEYLASLTEFEPILPSLFSNRIRIEKMTRTAAVDTITGPCEVHGIEVAEGFAQKLLEKLSPDKAEIELTYLQVFLDKLYRMAVKTNSAKPEFTLQMLEDLGRVGDILSDFLEEQIGELEDSEIGLSILKTFVSLQGTKKQINTDEIAEFTTALGKAISPDQIEKYVNQFVDLRILRDKDENGKYELRHDSLAANIYQKITVVEKELLEVRQFVQNSFNEYEKRGVLLSAEDYNYILPYEGRLALEPELKNYLEHCKRVVNRKQKREKVISVITFTVAILIGFLGYNYWRTIQQDKALLLTKITNSLVVSADKMNVLYCYVDNPISIGAVGISLANLHATISQGTLTKQENGRYIANLRETGKVAIKVTGEIESGEMVEMGEVVYRVKRPPPPFASFMKIETEGVLTKARLDATQGVMAKMKNFDFNLFYKVVSFTLSIELESGEYVSMNSDNNRLTEEMKSRLKNVKVGQRIFIENVKAKGLRTPIEKISGITIKIVEKL